MQKIRLLPIALKGVSVAPRRWPNWRDSRRQFKIASIDGGVSTAAPLKQYYMYELMCLCDARLWSPMRVLKRAVVLMVRC